MTRLAIDVAMAICYLLQMAPYRTGGWYHEVAGLVFVVLLVAHHALNIRWLRSEWRLRAWLALALDASLLACVAGVALSGMAMAQHVMPLRVGGLSNFARRLHACLTYLGFMLVCVHTGTHMPAVRRFMASRGESTRRLPRLLVCVVTVALGAYAFVRLGVATKLSMGMSFPDGTTPLAVLVLRHLLLAGPFVLVGGLIAPRGEKRRLQG